MEEDNKSKPEGSQQEDDQPGDESSPGNSGPEQATVSSVIHKAWDIFGRHLGLVLILALIMSIPSIILGIYGLFFTEEASITYFSFNIGDEPANQLSAGGVAFVGLMSLISLVLIVIINAITVVAFMKIIRQNQKQTLSFSEAWNLGAPYLGRIVAISLIVGLIVLGGLILLIIPGVLFALWYMYSLQVTIDSEDFEVKKILNRSKELFLANPGLPIFWGFTVLAISIGLSIVLIPVTLIPLVGVLVNSVVSNGLSIFGVIGFILVYFAAIDAAKGKTK